MIENEELHSELILVAAGVPGKRFVPDKVITNGERLLRENQALDILIWLIDNWVIMDSW